MATPEAPQPAFVKPASGPLSGSPAYEKLLSRNGRTRTQTADSRGGGGIVDEFGKRPNRSTHELPATIGANEAEHARGAVATKSAFKRTYECCCRIWRKVPVATFAIGSDFEGHIVFPANVFDVPRQLGRAACASRRRDRRRRRIRQLVSHKSSKTRSEALDKESMDTHPPVLRQDRRDWSTIQSNYDHSPLNFFALHPATQ
jgi:hypothetical protein